MNQTLVLMAGDEGYADFLLEGRNRSLLTIHGVPLIAFDAIGKTRNYRHLMLVGPPAVHTVAPDHVADVHVVKIEQARTAAANLREQCPRSKCAAETGEL